MELFVLLVVMEFIQFGIKIIEREYLKEVSQIIKWIKGVKNPFSSFYFKNLKYALMKLKD